ncbi:MAG: hypothetical protein RL264_2905 [Bacteroidota bacterium]|jgi:predicted membrane protein
MKREHRFKEHFNHWNMDENWAKRQRISKALAGGLIVTAGSLILAKQMGAPLPHWLFSWEMILISIGFVSLVKHQFKRMGGYIMVFIGSTFKLHDIFPNVVDTKILWPVIIIFIGAYMIFKSLFGGQKKKYVQDKIDAFGNVNDEDFVQATAILGGATNKVVNKNLKGVSVTSVMGGVELNMTQADFDKELTMNIDCVMGGVSLLIPSDWKVVSDVTTILGGMDDKRVPNSLDLIVEPKVLIIKGTCVMGGIELDSYDKSDSKNW